MVLMPRVFLAAGFIGDEGLDFQLTIFWGVSDLVAVDSSVPGLLFIALLSPTL